MDRQRGDCPLSNNNSLGGVRYNDEWGSSSFRKDDCFRMKQQQQLRRDDQPCPRTPVTKSLRKSHRQGDSRFAASPRQSILTQSELVLSLPATPITPDGFPVTPPPPSVERKRHHRRRSEHGDSSKNYYHHHHGKDNRRKSEPLAFDSCLALSPSPSPSKSRKSRSRKTSSTSPSPSPSATKGRKKLSTQLPLEHAQRNSNLNNSGRLDRFLADSGGSQRSLNKSGGHVLDTSPVAVERQPSMKGLLKKFLEDNNSHCDVYSPRGKERKHSRKSDNDHAHQNKDLKNSSTHVCVESANGDQVMDLEQKRQLQNLSTHVCVESANGDQQGTKFQQKPELQNLSNHDCVESVVEEVNKTGKRNNQEKEVSKRHHKSKLPSTQPSQNSFMMHTSSPSLLLSESKVWDWDITSTQHDISLPKTTGRVQQNKCNDDGFKPPVVHQSAAEIIGASNGATKIHDGAGRHRRLSALSPLWDDDDDDDYKCDEKPLSRSRLQHDGNHVVLVPTRVATQKVRESNERRSTVRRSMNNIIELNGL